MTDNFHQRCASALTHPLTIAALATLLLNDLALKPAWPDSWFTGKLSDLAWVVFASPLLAFFLSYLSRNNPFAERGAWATAYFGLPILYAAFNTFEPLHGWVLSILLPFTGSTIGSPLDPSDSLVIPVGLAVSVWIWKRPSQDSTRFRVRLCLLTAAITSLATVATSTSEPSPTEWLAGIDSDGTLILEAPHYAFFKSVDGGLTWAPFNRSGDEESGVRWGGRSVDTPRGTYSIEGSEVTLSAGEGGVESVYSVDFLNREPNLWAQAYTTRELREQLAGLYGNPANHIVTQPRNIIYDYRTGNVIVTMLLQGVVVGDEEGVWRRVAVGHFSPTDFSFAGKAGLLFGAPTFWFTVMAVSLAFITVVISFSGYGPSEVSAIAKKIRPILKKAMNVLLLVIVGFFLVLIAGALFPVTFSSFGSLTYVLAVALISISLPIVLTVSALTRPREDNARKFTAIGLTVLGAVLTTFTFPPTSAYTSSTGAFIFMTITTGGIVLTLLGASIFFPRRYQLSAYLLTLLSMNALSVLCFTLWIAGRVALPVAVIASITLLSLAALGLRRYLTRQHQDQFITPQF